MNSSLDLFYDYYDELKMEPNPIDTRYNYVNLTMPLTRIKSLKIAVSGTQYHTDVARTNIYLKSISVWLTKKLYCS